MRDKFGLFTLKASLGNTASNTDGICHRLAKVPYAPALDMGIIDTKLQAEAELSADSVSYLGNKTIECTHRLGQVGRPLFDGFYRRAGTFIENASDAWLRDADSPTEKLKV